MLTLLIIFDYTSISVYAILFVFVYALMFCISILYALICIKMSKNPGWYVILQFLWLHILIDQECICWWYFYLQLFYFLVLAQILHACLWLLNTWKWDLCIISSMGVGKKRNSVGEGDWKCYVIYAGIPSCVFKSFWPFLFYPENWLFKTMAFLFFFKFWQHIKVGNKPTCWHVVWFILFHKQVTHFLMSVSLISCKLYWA